MKAFFPGPSLQIGLQDIIPVADGLKESVDA